MSATSQDWELRRKIRLGEAIECLGLTFFPLTMRDYELFISCKDSLLIRQSSLPVKYLAMDYLSAIFAMDLDAMRSGNKNVGGAFFKIIRLLFSSLRLDYSAEKLEKAITYKKLNNDICISSIEITQNDKTVSITPLDFSAQIRNVIAEQNGLEIPDETENLSLVQSNEKKKELSSQDNDLNVNIDDLIASVAYLSHVSPKEINNWTIKEFNDRKNAIDRDKRYTICATAEMSGMVSFKNGNPAPSWCFDKMDNSLGTLGISKLGNILGQIEQK